MTRLSQLRLQVANSQYFSWALLVFIAGFFFLTSTPLLNTLYTALILLPWVLVLTGERIRMLAKSPVFLLVLLYATICALSPVWGDLGEDVSRIRPARHALYLTVFVAAIAVAGALDPAFLRKLLLVFMTAAAVGAVSAIVSHGVSTSWTSRLTPPGRLHQINLGAAVYGVMVIGTFVFCAAERARRGPLVWYAAACGLTGFVLLLMTQSRAPIAAFVVSIGLVIYLLGWRKLIIISVSTALLLLAVVLFNAESFEDLLGKRGLSYRPEIWANALRYFMETPWFGHGYGFERVLAVVKGGVYDHPHSAYISSLLSVGLTGTAVLLALMIRVLYVAVSMDHRYLRIGLLATIVFAMLCMLFDENRLVTSPRANWLYFWLPVALAAASELRLKQVDAMQSDH